MKSRFFLIKPQSGYVFNIDFRAETTMPPFAFPKNLTSSSQKFFAVPIDSQNVRLPFQQ